MRKIEANSRVGRGGGRDSTRPLRADRVGVRRGPRWTEVILREDTKAARKPVGITTTAREQGNTLCGFTFTIFLAFYVSGSTAPTRLAPSIRCSLFKIGFDFQRRDTRPPAARISAPSRHSNASHHAHPHRAQRGRAREAFKAHRSGRRSRTALLVKRASASSRRKARVDTHVSMDGRL